MREAIGNSFVLYFIITFIVLFMLIFVGMSTYNKAFKVKNKITDIIEHYDGDIESNDRLSGSIQDKIIEKLGAIGYKIDRRSDCEAVKRFNGADGGAKGTIIRKSKDDGFRYCIYRFTTKKGTASKPQILKRYAVVAYAYLEIPIIGAKLDFPVYGETKTFFNT